MLRSALLTFPLAKTYRSFEQMTTDQACIESQKVRLETAEQSSRFPAEILVETLPAVVVGRQRPRALTCLACSARHY